MDSHNQFEAFRMYEHFTREYGDASMVVAQLMVEITNLLC